MSEESYWRNVARGVTGPETGTCFVASLDRISKHHDVPPQTYEAYEHARQVYKKATNDAPDFLPPELRELSRTIERRVLSDVGVISLKNVVNLRVDSEPELEEKLDRLAQGGFRTVINLDTGGLHAVGVEQLDRRHYSVKSTWDPFNNSDCTTTGEIFMFLDRYKRLKGRPNARKSFKAMNIQALPPESRR